MVLRRLTAQQRFEHLGAQTGELEFRAVPELVRPDDLRVGDRAGERRLSGRTVSADTDEHERATGRTRRSQSGHSVENRPDIHQSAP